MPNKAVSSARSDRALASGRHLLHADVLLQRDAGGQTQNPNGSVLSGLLLWCDLGEGDV